MSYFLLQSSFLNYLVRDFQSGMSTLNEDMVSIISRELKISDIEKLEQEFFNVVGRYEESEQYINSLIIK